MNEELFIYMAIGQRALSLMNSKEDADIAWETAKSEYFNSLPNF